MHPIGDLAARRAAEILSSAGSDIGLVAARRALRRSGPVPSTLVDPLIVEVEPEESMAAGRFTWGFEPWAAVKRVDPAAGDGAAAGSIEPVAHGPGITNAQTIGAVLYTDYVYFFQAAGLVLLVAMIGAIVLTLKHRPNIKRQDIAAQVARTPAAGLRVVEVKSGEGIEL